MPLIQVEQLNRIYQSGEQQVYAVRNLDLVVEAREFTVLAGPSGSGKTTLLNLIGGLDLPDSGRVKVEGTDLSKYSATELASFRMLRIGFIFQSFNLIPVLTAEENAEFILMLQGMPRKERFARVKNLFARLGIDGLEHRRPAELSGGQQQRVAIARAMAPGPAVILADEPTANLDSDTAADLLALMRDLNRDQGTTFLFSSHDPQVIDHADRVVQLRDGQICL